MQIDLSQAPAIAALVALGAHVVIYANKEGKKDQRLLAVEEKCKSISSIETSLAAMVATVSAIGGKIDTMKSDLREDIAELRGQLKGR